MSSTSGAPRRFVPQRICPQGWRQPSSCSPVSASLAAHRPKALYMYWDTFGTKAEPNMWLEPVHCPNTRPRDEEIAEIVEWFKQRRRSQRKLR
jgi:hypothetical protein